jgi:transposase
VGTEAQPPRGPIGRWSRTSAIPHLHPSVEVSRGEGGSTQSILVVHHTKSCTVPGVGPITATAFVATIGSIDRFAGAHQLESYLGLVPSERSSGEKQRKGHITKAGNSRLQYLLVEAAWSVLLSRKASTEDLRAWAQRIGLRRGMRTAIVALARRLAGILYAMWRDGTTFELRRREESTAEEVRA